MELAEEGRKERRNGAVDFRANLAEASDANQYSGQWGTRHGSRKQ